MKKLYVVILFATAFVLAGCGSSSGHNHQGGSGMSMPGMSHSGADFDRTFIDAMVPHHRGAITMANQALAAGLSAPRLVQIAENVTTSQQQEIDQMLSWRADWFGSKKLNPNAANSMGMDAAHMGSGGMDFSSGMTASEVNKAFAQQMRVHHQGAIMMAAMALRQADHSEIKALARRIIRAQNAEIAVMRRFA